MNMLHGLAMAAIWAAYYSNSSKREASTVAMTASSYASRSSRYCTAASTLAGESMFGSASMLITLTSTLSTLCAGDHRSAPDSYCQEGGGGRGDGRGDGGGVGRQRAGHTTMVADRVRMWE